MRADTDRNADIQNKLEKERTNLDLLNQRVQRSKHITADIDSILNTFEQRLLRLEDTILPVYNETETLQKSQQNIERTLNLLDNVIGYYEVSTKVDDIIEKGPGVVSEPGIPLDEYLDSLNNLAMARKYFDKHIPQSVELENVRALYKRGSDRLHNEFKVVLDRFNKPILPVTLLNLINSDSEDTQKHQKQLQENPLTELLLNQYPAHVREDLIRMSTWLLANGRDEFLNVYAMLRGNILAKTMTALRNYQRSVSGGSGTQAGTTATGGVVAAASLSMGGTSSTASASGGSAGGVTGGTSGVTASSPMARAKFPNKHDLGVRRPSARKSFNQIIEKKANRMFLKASQTIGQSTGLNLGPRRSHSQLDSTMVSDEIDNEQEMENYLICVIAMHKLMQLEQQLMQGIVSDKVHQEKVFELIVKESMDAIVQDGENIASRARRCISRHDFSAVLFIFPILKQLQTLRPDFEKTVERNYDTSTSIALSKFNSILNILHVTGVKALDEFVESLRSDSITQLPRDGTVHELTSNVLMFLEHLYEYYEPIGSVLVHEKNSYSMQIHRLTSGANLSPQERNKALLGLYIKKVLDTLYHTLTSKSEQYGDPALKAIFRLNNTNYILKSLQQNNLIKLYRISEPKCDEIYYANIKGHKDAYLESWNKLLNYITAEDALAQSRQLKDKDRSLIKDKFSGFNREIEDIMKVQRGYSIPDVQVRESLKRDNKEYIIPKYNAFYNSFSEVNFTKNHDKYIKYKPGEIAAIIDRFFDVAA